jgi:cytochrome c peroxidase
MPHAALAAAVAALAAALSIGGLASGTKGGVPAPDVPPEAIVEGPTLPPTADPAPEPEPPVAAPPPPGAPTEDDLVELGRRLFFDPGASHSKAVSCASCHQPDHGFSDPQVTSMDDFGPSQRHSQPLVNLGTGPLHWDGEFADLETVVSARTGDSRRTATGYYAGSGASKVVPVADALTESGLYRSAFRATFGDPAATRDRVSRAIAAYVRTLSSTTSPFDRWLEGDVTALSKEAARGWATFRGRARCGACHEAEGDRPTFTDGKFHDTGIARRNGERRADVGRKLVTQKAVDESAFKTPSLRDVAIRAPYMHDGSFAHLDDVVRYYATANAKFDRRIDPALKPFAEGLPAVEIDRDVTDLVAFLGSLTGETRAGLAPTAWSRRAAKVRLRLVDPKGEPWLGRVAVAPAGDVLPGAAAPRTPVYRTPDADGWIEVSMPATTHLSVTVPGTNHRVRSGEFVPDTCEEAVLTIEPGPPFRRAVVDASVAAAAAAERRRR